MSWLTGMCGSRLWGSTWSTASQTPEATLASLTLSQQRLPSPLGRHSAQRHGHTTGPTGTLGAELAQGLVLAGIRLQVRKAFERGSYETLGQSYQGYRSSPEFYSHSGHLPEKTFILGIVIYSAKVSSPLWRSAGMSQIVPFGFIIRQPAKSG